MLLMAAQCAFYQRVVLFRAAHRELHNSKEFQSDNSTARCVDTSHASDRVIQVCQTIDPGVHVAAVKVWEPKRLREDGVERFLIMYLASIDLDNIHATSRLRRKTGIDFD